MIIQFKKLRRDAKIPVRASDGAVGYDLFASVVQDRFTRKIISDLPKKERQPEIKFGEKISSDNVLPWCILPGESVIFGIGVAMAIPWPYQGEIRPRSGLASKWRIELGNSPGTIDPDFRGEAGVLLENRGKDPFFVTKHMRIAQLVFSLVAVPELQEVTKLSSTQRGARGFGGTGLYGSGLGTEEYDKIIWQLDQYYMRVVLAIAERSTCVRGVKKVVGKYQCDKQGKLVGQTRKFGCVIVRGDNPIAQGFNDQYFGAKRCTKVGCLREELEIKSGTQLETCRAMHAEWWAITNAAKSGVSVQGATMYVNAEPCEICAKLIIGSEIETVVVLQGVYPQNGIKILQEAGINIRYVVV